MTTGISAPPIGTMMSAPSAKAISATSQKSSWLCDTTSP